MIRQESISAENKFMMFNLNYRRTKFLLQNYDGLFLLVLVIFLCIISNIIIYLLWQLKGKQTNIQTNRYDILASIFKKQGDQFLSGLSDQGTLFFPSNTDF